MYSEFWDIHKGYFDAKMMPKYVLNSVILYNAIVYSVSFSNLEVLCKEYQKKLLRE